jgi:hypothetical protein
MIDMLSGAVRWRARLALILIASGCATGASTWEAADA